MPTPPPPRSCNNWLHASPLCIQFALSARVASRLATPLRLAGPTPRPKRRKSSRTIKVERCHLRHHCVRRSKRRNRHNFFEIIACTCTICCKVPCTICCKVHAGHNQYPQKPGLSSVTKACALARLSDVICVILESTGANAAAPAVLKSLPATPPLRSQLAERSPLPRPSVRLSDHFTRQNACYAASTSTAAHE